MNDIKWKHTYIDYGIRKDCIIIHDKPDDYGMVLVMNRRGEYVLTDDFEEKPIKPKLTEDAMKAVERFAYSLMEKESYDLVSEVNSFREYHDII